MKVTSNKPTKGYGFVQTEVMVSNEISINAKALYAYYCSVQGGKDASWKSNDVIMAELGISDKTFKKTKAELISIGLITSTKRKDTSCLVSVNYMEISTSNTDEQWIGVKSTPNVKGKIDPTNSNIVNINITNTVGAETNEKAVASSATLPTFNSKSEINDIFDYLVEANVSELGYKEALQWKINTRDMENIIYDIENHGKEVILQYIDQHVKNHARNIKNGTARYNNVSYAAIHNNVKDNKFRE